MTTTTYLENKINWNGTNNWQSNLFFTLPFSALVSLFLIFGFGLGFSFGVYINLKYKLEPSFSHNFEYL